jgi:HD-GYP domain-containing protein (c-di-GMP phosphodiesterase class II)
MTDDEIREHEIDPEAETLTDDLLDGEAEVEPEAEPEPEPEESDRITDGPEATAASGHTFSVKQIRRVRDLLARLYALRRTLRFYPAEHPATRQATNDLFGVIAQYHAEGVDVPLTFFEDELLFGEQLLAEDSVLFDQLIRDMAAIGAGSMTFTRGLEPEELVRFSAVIGSDPEHVAEAGGLDQWMTRLQAPHIVVGTVAVVRDEDSEMDEDEQRAALASYAGAVDLLRELERTVQANRPVDTSHVRGVVRSLVDGMLRNRHAMLEISGLKSFDEYTFYHSVNVAILSVAMGSALTRDHRFLSSLGVGALLHDIGKMSIDREIIHKSGPLTSEEWVEVRRHPVFGAETAALTPGLDRASILCILEHHRRLDGTGYPRGGTDRPQHLTSRIVAVADGFDAMTSRRSYSGARLQDEAVRVLAKNAGTALDPMLVRLFIDLVGLYPPRSVVLLSSGEIGIVVSASAGDPAAPNVRVVADSSGTMIDPVDVDLSDEAAADGRSIKQSLDPAELNIDVADFL